eukprot:284819341_4
MPTTHAMKFTRLRQPSRSTAISLARGPAAGELPGKTESQLRIFQHQSTSSSSRRDISCECLRSNNRPRWRGSVLDPLGPSVHCHGRRRCNCLPTAVSYFDQRNHRASRNSSWSSHFEEVFERYRTRSPPKLSAQLGIVYLTVFDSPSDFVFHRIVCRSRFCSSGHLQCIDDLTIIPHTFAQKLRRIVLHGEAFPKYLMKSVHDTERNLLQVPLNRAGNTTKSHSNKCETKSMTHLRASSHIRLATAFLGGLWKGMSHFAANARTRASKWNGNSRSLCRLFRLMERLEMGKRIKMAAKNPTLVLYLSLHIQITGHVFSINFISAIAPPLSPADSPSISSIINKDFCPFLASCPDLSSRNFCIFCPPLVISPIISTIFFPRSSDALNSTISYPHSRATSFAAVDLPIPGAPLSIAALAFICEGETPTCKLRYSKELKHIRRNGTSCHISSGKGSSKKCKKKSTAEKLRESPFP